MPRTRTITVPPDATQLALSMGGFETAALEVILQNTDPVTVSIIDAPGGTLCRLTLLLRPGASAKSVIWSSQFFGSDGTTTELIYPDRVQDFVSMDGEGWFPPASFPGMFTES